MRHLVAAGLLLLVSFAAHAQPTCAVPGNTVQPWNTAWLSWVRPTQNSDGSALASTVAITYKVYNSAGTVLCQTTAVNAAIPNLSAGPMQCWTATATTTSESTKSNVACKDVKLPPPMPPGNLTVAADPTAYEIHTVNGQLVASRLGFVPLGTACLDETKMIGTVPYNRIDVKNTDLINFPSASLSTFKVYARCG